MTGTQTLGHVRTVSRSDQAGGGEKLSRRSDGHAFQRSNMTSDAKNGSKMYVRDTQ